MPVFSKLIKLLVIKQKVNSSLKVIGSVKNLAFEMDTIP